ncbi:basement membrane-specific heparan sulfate proteoglycan core protein-like, partial [Eucyclogobius newberryi]|uniref:basement membrane-specific heparan sulfate proteoglycan core protein-like n=1 Tax=Eucyclogobius newberryi TaxID=166745 RepID=UPI003B598B0D
IQKMFFLRVNSVSKSDEGLYSCGTKEEILSPEKEVKVTEHTRRVELTASNTDRPVEGSVTLSCDVEDWNEKLYWFRRNSYTDSRLGFINNFEQTLNVSLGGVYVCIGQDVEVMARSNDVTVEDRALTVSPSQLEVFVGESLTLRCEVEGGADREWTYHWSRNRLNPPPTTREYTVSRVTESDTGAYSCRAQRGPHHTTVWSTGASVTVKNKPQARVSGPSELQTGGSVELFCSVSPSSSGWKYEWSRNEQFFKESSSEAQVTVSEGGEYQCRAHRGDPPYFTEDSHKFRLRNTESRASLSVEPPWPQLFPGEQFSLTCRAQERQWTFEWRKNGQNLEQTQSKMTKRKASVSDSGSYSCRGVLPHTVTQWSPPITLSVSKRAPRPVLSVSGSWLSPGASVSLSCAVTAPSAGWSYHWYRAVPQSHSDIYYERLPGASTGSTQDSFSLQGLNNSAMFVCRAARGNPVFYSEYSDPSLVWSRDAEGPESLWVSPDRAQHFTDDVITLSCGFNSTGADRTLYRSFYNNTITTQQCDNYKSKDKSKCEFRLRDKTRAVFWCESGSGEMSNAVNISVHSDIILLSPVRAVMEGQSVSLSCKLRTGTFTSVQFYKNGNIIQNGTNPEFNISAVSRSDQGFYKCEGQRKLWTKTVTSAESWMSIKSAAKADLSPLPVMWVVGPVCAGLFLFILLLLLWRCSKTKEWDNPKAVLTAQGDTVVRGGHGWPNLTCSVNGSDQNWRYQWTVVESDYEHKFEDDQTITGSDKVTQSKLRHYVSGEIKCSIMDDCFSLIYICPVFVSSTVLNKATVKVQNSEFLPGETVNMTCEIEDYENQRWSYEWKTTSQISPTPGKNYDISNASEAHSGEYWCKGRMNAYYSAEWSPAITVATIKVSLGADGSVLPAGGVVTLNCSVAPSSSGWKYFWYKDTQATLLRTTEVAVLNISERGRYWCRGGRGSPVYYTHFSQPISIHNIGAVLAAMILVCVVVLLVLFSLIGLCWYKKTKGKRMIYAKNYCNT